MISIDHYQIQGILVSDIDSNSDCDIKFMKNMRYEIKLGECNSVSINLVDNDILQSSN